GALAAETADQQRGRPADRGQRYLSKRRRPPQCCQWNVDLPKKIARLKDVALVARDEVGDADALLAAIGFPDRADALERRRERDHRAGRQRHAKIATDGGGLPYLEGGQERPAALVDQGR